MNIVNTIIAPSVIFLALHFVWWFLFKGILNKTFGKSDSIYESGNMKTAGIVGNFAIEIFALIYFLIMTYSNVLNAFIFGLVLGGSHTSLSYALFKDYKLGHGVVCTLWKGVQFALTIFILRYFFFI